MDEPRERVVRLGPWFAAAATGVIALVWFLSRMSYGVSSGPWQACFAIDSPPFRGPLLSTLLSRLVCLLYPGDGLFALNVLSAVTGAVACGQVAHLVAEARARHTAAAWGAPIAGIGAGMLFALVPVVTHASTGAHPATLTVALALGAVALLVSAGDAARLGWRYAVSGLLAGLAAANHPSFGRLAVILMVGSVFVTPEGNPAAGMVCIGVGFFAGAAVPFIYAIGSGESVGGFLSHALTAPYPAWGNAGPERFFATRLTRQFWIGATPLALFAPLVIVHRGCRPLGVVLAAVVACFGPLLPVLTHETPVGSGVPEPMAPLALVVAACVVSAACGLAAMLETMPRAAGPRRVMLAVLLMGAGLAVGIGQVRMCPNRDHGLAAELPALVLRECPEDAVLVSGDPVLTSMLLATQRHGSETGGLRPDVLVIPVEAVWPPFGAKLPLTDRRVQLVTEFPSEEALSRWEREQPVALSRALQGENPDRAWRDLALWEFVRANASMADSGRALCFAGVDSPWLAARGRSTGAVTAYPREGDGERREWFVDLARRAVAADASVTDPELAALLARMLVVQSARARLQAEPENARVLGGLAAQLAPTGPRPLAALMRASARLGDQEAVTASTETYAGLAARTAGFTTEAAEALAREAATDLERHDLAEEFAQRLVRDQVGEDSNAIRPRATIAARLWALDELTVLAEGYGYVVAGGDENRDVRYEWAAALAQLGDLAKAREALKPVFEAEPEAIAERLRDDGRFALLMLTASEDMRGQPEGESDGQPT